jgi:hypothetical protein
MCCRRLVFLLAALLHLCPHVSAVRFHLRGHVISPQLHKRNHTSALDNARNLQYYTNITLGEKEVSVSIDAGRHVVLSSLPDISNSHLSRLSSDLWVADDILNSKDTGVSSSVQYAIGGISGNIRTAELKFLDFVVPDQAFSKFGTRSYPSTVCQRAS